MNLIITELDLTKIKRGKTSNIIVNDVLFPNYGKQMLYHNPTKLKGERY